MVVDLSLEEARSTVRKLRELFKRVLREAKRNIVEQMRISKVVRATRL